MLFLVCHRFDCYFCFPKPPFAYVIVPAVVLPLLCLHYFRGRRCFAMPITPCLYDCFRFVTAFTVSKATDCIRECFCYQLATVVPVSQACRSPSRLFLLLSCYCFVCVTFKAADALQRQLLPACMLFLDCHRYHCFPRPPITPPLTYEIVSAVGLLLFCLHDFQDRQRIAILTPSATMLLPLFLFVSFRDRTCHLQCRRRLQDDLVCPCYSSFSY